MSFPYYLDLAFGSEKASADSSGRISFGKPVVVGDKVRFISNIYQVSNDYTIEGNSVVPTTTKEAYSVLEINKSVYDENRDLFDSLYGQLSINSNAGSVVQLLLFGSMSNFELMVPLTSTDFNIGDPLPEVFECVLTTVSSYIYSYDESPSVTDKVGPVTIKTYIDNRENTDSSYIIVDTMNVSVTKEGEESNLPKSLEELYNMVGQGKAYQINCTNIMVEDQMYSIWDGTIDKSGTTVNIDPLNVEGFVCIYDSNKTPVYRGSVKPAPTYGTLSGYPTSWEISKNIAMYTYYYVVLKEAV